MDNTKNTNDIAAHSFQTSYKHFLRADGSLDSNALSMFANRTDNPDALRQAVTSDWLASVDTYELCKAYASPKRNMFEFRRMWWLKTGEDITIAKAVEVIDEHYFKAKARKRA